MPPPKEQMTKDKVSVSCFIKNFFPPDISVEWQRNGEPEQNFKTTQPVLDTDETYFLYSKVDIDRDVWQRGDVFGCSVLHEALHNHHTEKSLRYSPGK